MYIFILWVILAIFFLTLAVINWFSGRPIRKDLKKLAEEGPHAGLKDEEGEIELNDTVYRAFNATFIINSIGFILAAFAAIISAFCH